ncbi:hypothetical protein CN204_04375 [Sinorhizobium meliloti]|uniref:hypothetical protein n=1 Tax=Rhizobium meliloti TaxID=382 RepID=UPI000FD992A4|nr:hypothetical protein [Sinorhizobium meliloti]RVH87771.1 hypothetical protein CN204_04375 [Sinorhizobium meliloti]
MSITLKVVNLPRNEWLRAHRAAAQFLNDYPDRIGMRNGVIYSRTVGPELPIYVYRTKTEVVVRGSVERNQEAGQ